jgi:ketosteroid isomerase-like protein
MEKLDIRNLDACTNIIADNFVWHYFNPRRPELEGDYRGIEGLKGFFAKLAEISNGSFQVNVIDSRAVGDELVVTQACNRITWEGNPIEFDAVVVWRIVNGKIAEGWDIPSVYNVR